jgi:hypothetical protein
MKGVDLLFVFLTPGLRNNNVEGYPFMPRRLFEIMLIDIIQFQIKTIAYFGRIIFQQAKNLEL